MNLLNRHRWPEPEASIGEYRGMADGDEKKKCWDAKEGSAAYEARDVLIRLIGDILRSSCSRVPRCALLLTDVFLIGESPGSSVPYIMFSCSHAASRVEACKLVRKSGILKNYPGFRLAHWEYPPDLSSITRPAGTTMADDQFLDSALSITAPSTSSIPLGTHPALKLLVQAKPPDLVPTRACTLGAIIRTDVQTLYFTAHHVFDEACPEDSCPGDEKNAVMPQQDDDFSIGGDLSYDDSDYEDYVDVTSEIPESCRAQDYYHMDDGKYERGTRRTAPVPPQTPETGDMLPPTTAPNTIAELFYGSSEFDYALLDLPASSIPGCDLVEINEATVFEIGPGQTAVSAFTGSGRALQGTLYGRATYVRLPYGDNYQEVYRVIFSEDVQLGDSGSVIRGAHDDKIYGHLIVGSSGTGTAFIMPATKVLQDIRSRNILEYGSPYDSRYPHSSNGVKLAGTRLRNCLKHHNFCNMGRRLETNGVLPRRLLNVTLEEDPLDVCLLSTNNWARASYVALSYVWGSSPFLKAYKDNIEELNRPFSIKRLPRTIQDGICVTRDLGFKYIWIDALCIAQDDKDELANEVAQMASIYSNATLTIIAACGSSVYSGLFPSSSEPLSSTLDDEGTKASFQLLSQNAWSSRAWTFQEGLLSRRCLHFQPEGIKWTCVTDWTTSINDEISPVDYRILAKWALAVTSQPLTRGELKSLWLELLKVYMTLELTYMSDRLPALAGLARFFETKLQDEYIGGLWRHELPEALCWTVERPSERTRHNFAPSWSWASIRDGVSISLAGSDPEQFSSPLVNVINSYRIVPLTDGNWLRSSKNYALELRGYLLSDKNRRPKTSLSWLGGSTASPSFAPSPSRDSKDCFPESAATNLRLWPYRFWSNTKATSEPPQIFWDCCEAESSSKSFVYMPLVNYPTRSPQTFALVLEEVGKAEYRRVGVAVWNTRGTDWFATGATESILLI